MTLLDVFENIKKTLIQEEELKSNLKEVEEDIKEEYATIKGFRNKKGEVDKRQIKFSEVKSAGKKILFDDDKFEIKIANYDTYKNDIKNGEENFPVAKLNKYFELEEVKKEIKNDLKDIEEAATAIEELELDQKRFSYLIKLAKEDLKTENKNENNNDNENFEYIKQKLEELKNNSK